MIDKLVHIAIDLFFLGVIAFAIFAVIGGILFIPYVFGMVGLYLLH